MERTGVINVYGSDALDVKAADSLGMPWARRLALVILGGALVALAKKCSLSLGIPGHSALLWLSVMIAGRATIRGDGTGFLVGTATALWGVPFGLENSFGHNAALYAATGTMLDLVARLCGPANEGWLIALITGTAAHMVKFGFIVAGAFMSSVTKRFLLAGLVKAATFHLIFGAGAGLLAFLLIRGAASLRSPPR